MKPAEWMERARCRGKTALMFSEAGSRRSQGFTSSELAAKRLCLMCPVRRECLLESLRQEDVPFPCPGLDRNGQLQIKLIKANVTGIWGATTQAERQRTSSQSLAQRMVTLDALAVEQAKTLGLLTKREKVAA